MAAYTKQVKAGNVLIGGVRVYKYKAKNPVRISGIKSSELGNIFGNGLYLFHAFRRRRFGKNRIRIYRNE